MRRNPKALALLVAASAALSLSAACHKNSGGNNATQSPTPTPLAPANVAATAGNHTIHVSWDAVANATGYRLYMAPAAITSTAGMTPVFVATSFYDVTNATNWVTEHFRVSTEVGSTQSVLSNEAQATPGAGYVVATHVAGSHSLAWFHADETDVMSDSVANGELIPQALVGTTGALYGVITGSPGIYSEVGIAHGNGHTVYANTATHTYQFLGFAAGRPVFADSINNTQPFSVVSFALDGTDPRTLLSNCATIGAGIYRPAGLSADCVQGTTHTEYYSDGVNPGIQLPEDPLNSNFVPTFITSTRVYFNDNTGATVRAVAQTFDMSAPTDVLGTGSTGTTQVLAVGASKIAVSRKTLDATPLYDLFLCNLDASGCASQTTGQQNPIRIDSQYGVSRDGHRFLYSKTDQAIIAHDDGTMADNVTGTTIMGKGIASAYFLPGDTTVLLHLVDNATSSSIIWQTVEAATGNSTQWSFSSTFNFVDFRPGFVLMHDPATHKLDSYTGVVTAGVPTINPITLSSSATPTVVFNDDLSVIWQDLDGTTHMSNADKSLAPLKIDAGQTIGLQRAGTAADGRNYFVTERSPTDFDTMMVTLTSTSAQTIAGSAASDSGVFLP